MSSSSARKLTYISTQRLQSPLILKRCVSSSSLIQRRDKSTVPSAATSRHPALEAAIDHAALFDSAHSYVRSPLSVSPAVFFPQFPYSSRSIGSSTLIEEFHCAPFIRHYRNNDRLEMKPGMVFTIEPMLTEGDPDCIEWTCDGWTVVTRDGGRAAQFEHMVLITDNGCEVLTLSE